MGSAECVPAWPTSTMNLDLRACSQIKHAAAGASSCRRRCAKINKMVDTGLSAPRNCRAIPTCRTEIDEMSGLHPRLTHRAAAGDAKKLVDSGVL